MKDDKICHATGRECDFYTYNKMCAKFQRLSQIGGEKKCVWEDEKGRPLKPGDREKVIIKFDDDKKKENNYGKK